MIGSSSRWYQELTQAKRSAGDRRRYLAGARPRRRFVRSGDILLVTQGGRLFL
jgi:hypothetical protein